MLPCTDARDTCDVSVADYYYITNIHAYTRYDPNDTNKTDSSATNDGVILAKKCGNSFCHKGKITFKYLNFYIKKLRSR